MNEDYNGLTIGQILTHVTYGRGVITNLYTKDRETYMTVKFKNQVLDFKPSQVDEYFNR